MNQQKWIIDPDHSGVQFKIKHLVISNVTGAFNNFNGGASFSNPHHIDDAEVHFSLDVHSIDTNQEQRDTHLKSADFFDAEHFPQITFQSAYFRKMKGNKYSLAGTLTMKGVSRPVELEAEYGGVAVDTYGKKKIGFEVKGNISRWEFGLTYNAVLEGGGLLLGEDVQLEANIQLIQD
ncbi:YceI family protein [Chitinophaga sp.]|uniref:YceI family protein n=1 Tax=Chitinophaga sp. TaxID=1869181 RepID=UPI0031D31822